jgi:hypothetical protein
MLTRHRIPLPFPRGLPTFELNSRNIAIRFHSLFVNVAENLIIGQIYNNLGVTPYDHLWPEKWSDSRNDGGKRIQILQINQTIRESSSVFQCATIIKAFPLGHRDPDISRPLVIAHHGSHDFTTTT